MSSARDLFINLAAAILGALAVKAWRAARVRYTYRASRTFWRPLLAQPSRVVLCEFVSEEARYYEPVGFTGLAELHALVDLTSKFAESDLPWNLRVTTSSDHTDSDVSRENLIILGGPDVNMMTRRMLEAAGCSFRIERDAHDRNIVRDVLRRENHTPAYPEVPTAEDAGGGNSRRQEITKFLDYGVLVRMPNPFNPERQVLILAGAYGYGVLAAAQAVIERTETLLEYVTQFPNGFECLVSYSVLESLPGLLEIKDVRQLPGRA